MKVNSLVTPVVNFKEMIGDAKILGITLSFSTLPEKGAIFTVKRFSGNGREDLVYLEESKAYMNGIEMPFDVNHFKEVQAPGAVNLQSIISETKPQ